MKLSDAELEGMIAAGENERCEFKGQLKNDKDDVYRDICAFSNDLASSGEPGYVFVGIQKDGTPSGVPITENDMSGIADMKYSGHVLPWPAMTVQRRRLFGGDVAVIRVEPHPHPPVRYGGRVCIRVDQTRRIASPVEEVRLAERRRSGDLPYVLRPAVGAEISDLDLEFCEQAYVPAAISREVLEANERTLHQKLASLRVITPDAALPTIGGLLLVGLDPAVHVPGARVDFVRFDGMDRAGNARAQHTLSTGLLRVFELVETLLPLYIDVRSAPGDGLRRVDTPAYPEWALREYIFNGIIHRNYDSTSAAVRVDWYDDRVEITSPGGLYGHVTKDNFKHMNDYRNELLAVAARTMGWVEKLGQGIARAERLLRENGNPDPEYAFDAEYVLVTVRSARA